MPKKKPKYTPLEQAAVFLSLGRYRRATEVLLQIIIEHEKKIDSFHHTGEWQLCPKCNGDKYIINTHFSTANNSVHITCTICNGLGLLVRPIMATVTTEIDTNLLNPDNQL